MPYRESHSLQFRWEVFNVPNLTRFNAQGVGASLLTSFTQSPNNFGAYTSLLTPVARDAIRVAVQILSSQTTPEIVEIRLHSCQNLQEIAAILRLSQ